MKLDNISKKSIFSSIGNISDENDLNLFLRYVNYNKNFICNFPHIIYSLNGNRTLCDKSETIIKNIFSGSTVEFIFSENLGHTFGTLLLDNLIFKKSSELVQYDYIWKFSNDTIVDSSLLTVDIPIFDFYYINNIGCNCFVSECKNVDDILFDIKTKKYFYPQTNYYIIKNKTIFYPTSEDIYKLHNQFIKRENKNLKPWDIIMGCECENFLRITAEKNNLSSYMLLNDLELKQIIKLVYDFKIWDGSHKNIAYKRLGNLCHFQWSDKEVILI